MVFACIEFALQTKYLQCNHNVKPLQFVEFIGACEITLAFIQVGCGKHHPTAQPHSKCIENLYECIREKMIVFFRLFYTHRVKCKCVQRCKMQQSNMHVLDFNYRLENRLAFFLALVSHLDCFVRDFVRVNFMLCLIRASEFN